MQLFNKMVHIEDLMMTPHSVETCSQSIVYNKLVVFDGNFLIFIITIDISGWHLSKNIRMYFCDMFRHFNRP